MRALRVLKRPSLSFPRGVHRFTVAGLGKLIERAGVAAKIGFKVLVHTAKSSAGANKHEFGAHTDPDAPLLGPGPFSRVKRSSICPTVFRLNYLIGMS